MPKGTFVDEEEEAVAVPASEETEVGSGPAVEPAPEPADEEPLELTVHETILAEKIKERITQLEGAEKQTAWNKAKRSAFQEALHLISPRFPMPRVQRQRRARVTAPVDQDPVAVEASA